MSRLPFDFGKVPPRVSGASTPADAPLTVTELAARLSGAIRGVAPAPLRVIGEVSGLRASTHWYFSVKDEGAVISCVMFASSASRAPLRPADGQRVIVTGRPDLYAKSGRLSFVVERIEPAGEGALDRAFRELCEELRGLGWFEPGRKRPLPAIPRRVAVVTSRSGAAVDDVINTMRLRGGLVELLLVDVRVQGEGAAAEIARAVAALSRRHRDLGVDAILLTRGGGSIEDLWAFNERVVAQAIVASAVPVVAAIGHERDTTIAELVADLRCATPTQAAMRLSPDSRALMEQADRLGQTLRSAAEVHAERRGARLRAAEPRLARGAQGALERQRSQLDRLAARLERSRPDAVHRRRVAIIERLAERLRGRAGSITARYAPADAAQRLRRAVVTHAQRRGESLAALARQLEAIGPASVLGRGYSYTTRGDGSLLRSARDATPGDALATHLADGVVRSIVESAGAPGPITPSPASKRTRPKRADSPMDLFDAARYPDLP